MVLSLVLFARTILDGLLYTIVKLIWKLIQSRIVPTLVLVDIFWLPEQPSLSQFGRGRLSLVAILFYALSLLFGPCCLSEFTFAKVGGKCDISFFLKMCYL